MRGRPVLLWQEYKAEDPDGYQYSQFAELYRRFEKKLSVVLRQSHRPGKKVFVDFCDRISLVDPLTGEVIPTQLFVGALGESSYTFAIATLSQELPVWLDCHVRTFELYSGVTALTIWEPTRQRHPRGPIRGGAKSVLSGTRHPLRHLPGTNRS